MSDYPKLRKLQDIIDNQADRILDLEAALKEAGEMWIRKDNRIEQLEASLAEWKALAIQWAKDNDQSSPSQRLDSVEEIAKALLMEGRITPNTARALMASDQSPPPKEASRRHNFEDAGFDTCRHCGERKVHPDHQPERDIDAERLDASGSYWPDGRRPPDAIG